MTIYDLFVLSNHITNDNGQNIPIYIVMNLCIDL